MNILRLLLTLLFVAVPGPAPSAVPTADDAELVVVVNPANVLKGDDTARASVRQLYLKQRSEWPVRVGGEPLDAKPFGRAAGSVEQRAFLSAVLGMSEVDLVKHWIDLKQRTGQTEPRSLASDRMVLKMVAKYPGGFGVVDRASADEQSDSVRVLFAL